MYCQAWFVSATQTSVPTTDARFGLQDWAKSKDHECFCSEGLLIEVCEENIQGIDILLDSHNEYKLKGMHRHHLRVCQKQFHTT
jgi:hypothetical protein